MYILTPKIFDPYGLESAFINFDPQEACFLKKVTQIITCNLSNCEFGVSHLAKEVHFSVSQLNRRLNLLIDKPAGKLIREIRMEYAVQLLDLNNDSISGIAYQIGYKNHTHFCRSFKQVFGCTPSDYLNN